ncbi:helix-turn-helix domain-containing protein [Heyndrickxia camelliae]|uniref:HTH cro/C1-type domain-containing protein n=1 Tax=Heyndrickxia camelliae TaxID=1707093 RepID=A0A2N3LEU1_9BACI|nr:helix-turn-helix transcriptional regulator [Heyndrickxia camelliae]PKR83064.1 hypothetical protein CWO92_21240 [Heyndrickxia camelliae]
METLGERLKYLRKSRKLTQTDLAEKLHLTRNQISTYEMDQVQPGIDVIISYCKFFKVTSDVLLNINNMGTEISLLEQLIVQIQQNTMKMNENQREQYLKHLRLYAIFLERYKENL